MAIESITQIKGVYVGHATDAQGGTGCTVVVVPKGATGGVDVRGGAPATRETDLLRPEETVEIVNAIVLSGGSAFGLAASCGVADELESRSIGVDVGVTHVPIVCQACVFDLAYKDPHARPTAEMGRKATIDAFERKDSPLPRGNVGGGTGCTVGKALGPDHCQKAGIGEGVVNVGNLEVAAISCVNALGDICDPTTGKTLAGLHVDGKFISSTEATLNYGAAAFLEPAEDTGTETSDRRFERTNTTISCVVTNAKLTKAQATKVAQIAADAYAHAIHPTHTTNDGDAIFVLATGEVEGVPVDVCGVAATRALERAICDAALSARES
jgi:L-aminopeptidase/D-esterase-like protein